MVHGRHCYRIVENSFVERIRQPLTRQPKLHRDHGAVADQRVDLVVTVAIFRQHLASVLTQQRGATCDTAGGRRELDRHAECLDRTQLRVRRLGHHLSSQRLGVAVHLGDVKHRAGGHPGHLEAAKPVGARARSDDWRQRLGQFDAVGDAAVVVGEARVLAQLGPPDS